MAGGGSSLQASLTVVVVDTTLFASALLVLQGTNAFSSVTPAAAAVFLGAGLVGTALGRLATFTGVDRVGASINSAGISARPLFASVLAAGFLGQAVEPVVGAGILVLVAGLVVLALSKGGDLAGWDPRDLVFPLAAAFFFGVGNVARAYGLRTFGDVTLLEAVALNEAGALVALAGYGAYAARGDIFSAPRRTYAYFAGSGTLTAVALLALFGALELGRVAVVDPLAATAAPVHDGVRGGAPQGPRARHAGRRRGRRAGRRRRRYRRARQRRERRIAGAKSGTESAENVVLTRVRRTAGLRRPPADATVGGVYVVESTALRTLLLVVASLPGRRLVTALFEEVVQKGVVVRSRCARHTWYALTHHYFKLSGRQVRLSPAADRYRS